MKRVLRKVLAIVISISIIIGLLPGVTVRAAGGFDYSSWDINNKVRFNGYDWYVIDGSSSSVTLLAADPIGVSCFDSRPLALADNVYSHSAVKEYLDDLTGPGGAFEGVSGVIESVDLPDVNVSGAKLYLLSVSEALNVPENLRITVQKEGRTDKADNFWWLRSQPAPAGMDKFATCVSGGNGTTTDSGGDRVDDELDVRPALRLNLGLVSYSAEKNEFIPDGGSGYNYDSGRFDYKRWNKAVKVNFNDMEWFVTDGSDTSVTLFAADTLVWTAYSASGNISNDYSTSNVKWILDEQINNSEIGRFCNVANVIKSVDLPDVGVTGVKLYLLSLSEAAALPVFMRKLTFENEDHYANQWLRTPSEEGLLGYNVDTIISDGGLVYKYDDAGNRTGTYAAGAHYYLVVRPALQLNLGAVSFSEETRTFVPSRDQLVRFVTRLYEIALGREPEPAGLENWTSQLWSGEKNAVDIVYGVLCSPEYLGKGKSNEEVVTDCYNAMLDRNPDADGFNDWTSRLNDGMSINAIFAGFVGSREFGNLCAFYGINPGTYTLNEGRDKNYGVTKFVSRLYTQALGRSYDVDGLNDWCDRINNDTSRENVLSVATNGFFHSEEFLQKGLSDEDFVRVCYRTYLGREAEPGGFEDWVDRLRNGTGRDEVMRGFAYSEEFSKIMAEYGL